MKIKFVQFVNYQVLYKLLYSTAFRFLIPTSIILYCTYIENIVFRVNSGLVT